jgi:hypothetical protein
MYYLINPLSWPFTIIPNLPPNLFEVIDSPIPLLIGILGNKDTAIEINEIRNGNCNIIIINNSGLQYYKEEKINFSKEPMNNLYFSLLKNYSELKMNLTKKKEDENLQFVYEKIYKNIYGSIQNLLIKKIKKAIEKYKNFLKRSNNNGKSIDTLKTEELELREKIKNDFVKGLSEEDNSEFYLIFSQTQIFASYLDIYLEKNNKKFKYI